jgi:transposase InsO family protein
LIHRYRFISEYAGVYGVARLCRVLAVKRRQGYYEWLAAAPARQARADDDEQLAQLIRQIQAEHPGYGSPRITAELRRRGLRINRKRVERVMRERGLAGITRRRRRSLTKQDTRAAPAPDLIRRDFTAVAPGMRLVGDITYLPTAEGWLYLATTIDLFNREVVGHAMATHIRAELVCDAVELAHRRGLVRSNAIFHSDRGSQYTSKDLRRSNHLPSRYERLRARGLLTIGELARHLGVHPSTIKSWVNNGLLTGHKATDKNERLFEAPAPGDPRLVARQGIPLRNRKPAETMQRGAV